MNNKVFLGGTCAGTTWRDELIPMLEKEGIAYFNPVVKNWTPADQEKEEREKLEAETHLYYITSAMKGVYSIAEIVDSFYQEYNVVFCFNPEGFDTAQIKSLKAVCKLLEKRSEGFDFNSILHSKCEVNSVEELFEQLIEATNMPGDYEEFEDIPL